MNTEIISALIYQKLKKLVPNIKEILSNYDLYKTETALFRKEEPGFDKLVFEILYKNGAKFNCSIGYYYLLNGDRMSSPDYEFTIDFNDLSKPKCRVIGYQLDGFLPVYKNINNSSMKEESDGFSWWLDAVYANHGPLESWGNTEQKLSEVEELVVEQQHPEPEINDDVHHKISIRKEIRNNIQILNTLLELEGEKRDATNDELKQLSSFMGLGSINDLFFTNKYPLEKKEFMDAAYALGAMYGKTKDEVELEVYGTSSNMFFTPSGIGKAVTDVLTNRGYKFKNILEPAIGTGNMIRDILKNQDSETKIVGVDKNFLATLIAKHLYPRLQVLNQSYSEYYPQEKHDLVISNVPFDSNKIVRDKYWSENGTVEQKRFCSKLHSYYFAKTLENVREGGFIAFVAPMGIADSQSNEALRKYMCRQADFLTGVRLPNNIFSNTKVSSDLLIFKKREGEVTYQNQRRNEQFIGSTLINIKDEKIEQELRCSISGYFHENPEQILGKLGLNKMHGGLKMTVDPENQEMDLELQIKKAIAKNIPYYEDFKTEIRISYDRTPKGKAEELCDRSLDLLGMVRDNKEWNYIHTEWNKLREDVKNLTADELTAYKQVRNEYNIFSEYNAEKDTLKVVCLLRDHSKIINEDLLRDPVNLDKVRGEFFTRWTKELPNYKVSLARALDVVPEEYRVVARRGVNSPEAAFDAMCYVYTAQKLAVCLAQLQEIENRNTSIIADREMPGLTEKRSEMNRRYNQLIDTYGGINDPDNRMLLLNTPTILSQKQFYDLTTLEKYEGDKIIGLADIFKPLEERERIQLQGEVKGNDLLLQSLNIFGSVHKNYIENKAPGTIQQLLEENTIFENPENEELLLSWDYLSGNVLQKLEKAREAAVIDPKYARNVEALEQILPAPKPIQEIVKIVNLGERWIPLKYYQDFINTQLDVKATIKYIPGIETSDVYIVEETDHEKTLEGNGKWYLCPYWNASEIIQKAFAGTYPYVTNKKDVNIKGKIKTIQVPNAKLTKAGAILVESIRNEWRNYCVSNIELREFLEKEYNQRFNNLVLPKIDGSFLTFDDMQGNIKLYPSQKNAICGILFDKKAQIDHYPGAGKTMIMCVGAHEIKRLRKARKPMIIGLKANVKDLYKEHMKLYPNDKILYVNNKSFGSNKNDRIKFLSKIMNDDWDCIYITHSQFAFIPQDWTVMLKEIKAESKGISDQMDQQNLSKKQKKGLVDRLNNLIVLRKSIIERMRKDSGVPNFKQLGIDQIFVDESHMFKNLGFATKHMNLAGLGNSAGSQRAYNMLMACRTIQQRRGGEKGVVFLSGTPISNSLTELFNLQRYLCPSFLTDKGIYNIDAWIATYGDTSVEHELSVTGLVVPKERLRGFTKADDLIKQYYSMADVLLKTDKIITADTPVADFELVKLQPTPIQEIYNDLLLALALAKNEEDANWLVPLLFDDPDKQIDEVYLKAKMVVVYGLAQKASIHPGLMRSDFKDLYSPKNEKMIENALKYYNITQEERGVQIIFSNIGCPSDKSKKNDNFILYQHIKDRLIQQGVPAKEIAFIHDFKDDDSRSILYDKINAGECRFILGSTEKLGTGVNIQERICCIHQIDIPKRPDWVDQRVNRGARQGNILARNQFDNKVKSYFYATEKMAEVSIYGLLDIKSNFVKAIHSPDTVGSYLKFDEENEAPSFDEYVADLTGDNNMLKKIRVEKQLEDLDFKEKHYLEKKSNMLQELNKTTDLIEYRSKNIELFRKEKAYLDHQLKAAEIETVKDIKLDNTFDLTFFKGTKTTLKLTKNDEIGKLLLSVLKENKTVGDHLIATYYGYDLIVQRTIFSDSIDQLKDVYQNSIFLKSRETGLSFRMGIDAQKSDRTAGLFLKETLSNIFSRPDEIEKQLLKLEQKREGILADIEKYPKEFEDKHLFVDLKKELERLQGLIIESGEKGLKERQESIKKLRQRYEGHPEVFEEDIRSLNEMIVEKAIRNPNKQLQLRPKFELPEQTHREEPSKTVNVLQLKMF